MSKLAIHYLFFYHHTMIKKISLALFTLWYASVSLVIVGMKINHHGLEHHDDQGASHIVGIAEDSSCGEKNTASCVSCGDGGGEGCCDNETTCFVKCSKGVGLYAYTNPKDENEQIQGDVYIPSLPYFITGIKPDEYKIIGHTKKDLAYQISQTPHYRVGIIQLVL
ncbi:MAG TPA: hypothetical protein PLW93_04700 [Candidatus Absconditabacterales bacterium]|nr:hypothetical protein [Candidatus Absconditabacterales bacterium]